MGKDTAPIDTADNGDGITAGVHVPSTEHNSHFRDYFVNYGWYQCQHPYYDCNHSHIVSASLLSSSSICTDMLGFVWFCPAGDAPLPCFAFRAGSPSGTRAWGWVRPTGRVGNGGIKHSSADGDRSSIKPCRLSPLLLFGHARIASMHAYTRTCGQVICAMLAASAQATLPDFRRTRGRRTESGADLSSVQRASPLATRGRPARASPSGPSLGWDPAQRVMASGHPEFS